MAKSVKKSVKKQTKPIVRVKGGAIKLISAHAKKIWKKSTGEKWTDAIKRASAELKKAGKI